MTRTRVCSTPTCPTLTTHPKGLCDTCRAAANRRIDARRPTAHQRGYGPAWQARRARYLADHPTCQHPGCAQPATDVDHRTPQRPTGREPDHALEGLCHRHHSLKTATHDIKRGPDGRWLPKQHRAPQAGRVRTLGVGGDH